jgi:hypothetical protein
VGTKNGRSFRRLRLQVVWSSWTGGLGRLYIDSLGWESSGADYYTRKAAEST